MSGANTKLAIKDLYQVAPGQILVRNHHNDYPGLSFNPCQGQPGRFSPIHDSAGDCVPSLYAGGSFDVAAYETMFRGEPGPYNALPRHEVLMRGVSKLCVQSQLDLVPFFDVELRASGLDPAHIFASDETIYPECQALARQAYEQFKDAKGIIWTSVRDNAAHAVVLFGDRVDPNDLITQQTERFDTSPALMEDIIRTARRGGYKISR